VTFISSVACSRPPADQFLTWQACPQQKARETLLRRQLTLRACGSRSTERCAIPRSAAAPMSSTAAPASSFGLGQGECKSKLLVTMTQKHLMDIVASNNHWRPVRCTAMQIILLGGRADTHPILHPCPHALSAQLAIHSTSDSHFQLRLLPSLLPLSGVQPIVQWGFIPAIIVAGMMFTKPRPTLGQLVLLG
jgi:hypothetical protein